ncbi:serine/threonine protein kinase [Micromonospora arida]|uniref:serine/threonine protein kinase n=1 Tax=Micromonospora zamorensis TaxID=709883 RepID=UPI003898FE02
MPENLSSLHTDRYVFAGLLGQGGMGRVWKARDTMLERDVAIKEILPPPGLTGEARQELRVRSLREARAIARLDHVHAIRVFDVLIGESGDPWIVMEYVPSRALAQRLSAEGPVSPTQAGAIGLAVLSALRAAHRAGVVHRDVKPANILLGSDGRIVLTDFGLATAANDTSLTLTGMVLGSPAYLSPERARGGTAGPEGDLWSLGATLFAAVEGQAPYARPSSLMSLTALVTEPPPVAKRAGRLAPVIEGLLRKDPAERLDAETVERLLREVVEAGPAGAAWLVGGSALPRVAADNTEAHATPAPGGPVFRVEPGSEADPSGGRRDDHSTGSATRDAVQEAKEPAGGAPGQADVAMPLGASSHRLRRARLVAALAVLLIALGIGVGVPLLGDEAADSTEGAPLASGPSPEVSASTVSDPRAPATALSWSNYRDGSGFTMPVPKGWKVARKGGQAEFREPNGDRVLVVRQTDTPPSDPVAELTAREKDLSASGQYQDYRRISIVAVNYQRSAADWEWTHTAGPGRVTHVRQRSFITGERKAYTIVWSTPESAWAVSEAAFRKVVDGFRPAEAPRPSSTSASPPAAKPSTTPSTAPSRLPGNRIVGVESGRCLDIGDPDSAVTLRVRIMDCDDARARSQRWTFSADGSIRLAGRCLDVANASTEDGAVIQLTTCNGGSAQRFTLNVERQLVNSGSGKCLDVTDWGSQSGTPIQQWTCNMQAGHQKWRRG